MSQIRGVNLNFLFWLFKIVNYIKIVKIVSFFTLFFCLKVSMLAIIILGGGQGVDMYLCLANLKNVRRTLKMLGEP